MAEFSKLEPYVVNSNCQTLVHPWTESCLFSTLDMIRGASIGNSKFMAVLYLIQLLVRYKKRKTAPVTREYLKKWSLSYLRSALLYGNTWGVLFVLTHCITRRITGRYFYLTIGFLPGLISGLSIFAEDPARRPLVISTFSNMTIELLLRALQKGKYLDLTYNAQTIIFMCSNAIVMYILKKYHFMKIEHFWLYTPSAPPANEDMDCLKIYNKEFQKHLLIKTFQYFSTGYALQLVRLLLSKFSTIKKNPLAIVSVIWNGDNLKFGCVLGSYIAIYELMSAYLCNVYGEDNPEFAAIAGFFSGLSYRFYPNMTVLTSLMANIFKVGTPVLQAKGLLPEWSFGPFVYIMASAFLQHARAVHADVCPKLIIQIMSTSTSGISDNIYNNYDRLLRQHRLK